MITVVIIGIIIVFLLIASALGYFFYSLINKNKNMNGEQKTKAIDVFVYLGIAISLIWSVYNLLQIVFTAIDRKFPDLLTATYSVDIYSSDVRMAIASLVVMYPLYLALSWYVAKDITKFPYKHNLGVRKIMIYATLFITVCTLVGTLVSLIYNYLGGDLSLRFVLKALTVFVVALALFGYYLYSMRRDYTIKTSVPVLASIIASVVVIASLVWSVMIIGTPAQMRAKRIDSTRLSNLSSIQQQIFNRFQTTDKLPASLSELNDAFQGYSVPTDPVTGDSYTYKIVQQPVVRMNYNTNKKELITNAIFELCANFDIARDSNSNGKGTATVPIATKPGIPLADSPYSVSNYYYEYDQSPFWNHGTGEFCFKRIISSDMYFGN